MNATLVQASERNRIVEQIAALWHRSREAVIAIGQALLVAKGALAHGEFTAMIDGDLPFGPDTARRFIRIAADPKLSNHATLHVLPESYAALDELRKLPEKEFNEAVTRGAIHGEMTVSEAKALANSRTQERFYKDCPKCGENRLISQPYCKSCHAAYMRERVIEWGARAAFNVMIERSLGRGQIDEVAKWEEEAEELRDDWRAAIRAAFAVPGRNATA